MSQPKRSGFLWRRWARLGCVVGSGLLCVGLVVTYLARPDALATITVFPVWVWVVPGLSSLVMGRRGVARRVVIIMIVLWAAFVLAMAEEPRSLARSLLPLPVPPVSGMPLRVITLNSNVGDVRAADEVIALRPDIVMIQESPNRKEIEALARRLFGDDGGFVHGVDASLIARGTIIPCEMPAAHRGAAVAARVMLPGGRAIQVASVRLIPAVFRLDLWSPDCWVEQTENRRRRRGQLQAIARALDSSSEPLILGGDFNAPQGDAVFDVLRPRLSDSFAGAGRGWGNTITNSVPALRIDQIWISDEFTPRSVKALPTHHSDHRMVVSDLILKKGLDPAK